MHYLRSVASVLSAPLLYGVLCVPLLGMFYGQFPELINEQGGTRNVPLLLVHGDIDAFIPYQANARASLKAAQPSVRLNCFFSGSSCPRGKGIINIPGPPYSLFLSEYTHTKHSGYV